MNNKSSSRVSAGARNQSSSSEDERGSYNGGKRKRRQKLHIKEQKFVIHPDDLRAIRSELCGAQRSPSDSTTIPLDDRNSEKEIRARLLKNLPQLKGKSFKLFTTGKHGHIFCPCSQNCQDPEHAETPVEEWNAKNIKKLARGHKVVYIHCQENRNEEGVLHNTEHISHSSVALRSMQSHVVDVHVPVRGELLPKLAMKRKCLNDEEISRLVTKVSLDDNKDTLRLPVTDGKKEEKNKGEEEREEEKEEEEEEEEEEEDDDEEEDEEEELESGNQSLLGNFNVYRRQPRIATPLNSMFPDSAYQTGSTTTIGTMDTTRRNEMAPLLSHSTVTEYMETPLNQEPIRTIDEIAPTEGSVENTFGGLLVNDDAYTSSPLERTLTTPLHSIVRDSAYQTGSTTTIFPGMETDQRSERASMLSPLAATGHMETPRNQEQMLSVKIDEITPKEGPVEGGYTFFITLGVALQLVTSQLQVMFGKIPGDPDSVCLINNKTLKGKVPQSPTIGVVQVKLLNGFGETISINTVPFEYTEQKDEYKAEVQKYKKILDEEVTTPQQCTIMASCLFEKMNEFQSNCKGGKSYGGNSKTRSLPLLRMIVESAAKVNAMELFIIIFSTSVGRNVFKSFKNQELSLEKIARQNGHEELACFLEQRHLKYREDECDSDDDVDWASLAKATRNYQRQKGGSTGSSEDSRDYNGDVEDSLSFLSESDEIVETFLEEPLVESEKPSQDNCQEDSQTVIQEEPMSWCKRPLPDLPYSLVGRDKECEEIVGNFVSNQFRIGVICGSLGIGKTSVAVEVGHKLLSMGWTVSYHLCSDVEPTSEIVTPFANLYQVPNSAAHLKNDNINDTFSVEGSQPTLLILDQVENVNKAEFKALQTFVDDALNVKCIKLLLVSRKEICFTDDLAFYIKLKPLSEESAIQLLQSFLQISSHHDLGLIAKGCGCNPLALMIIRSLIDNGMPEKDIASKMSSPENFWKKQFHIVKKCHVLTETGKKEAQKDSLKLPLSGLVEINATVQMQMFLESRIEETSHLDKKQITCYENTFDPRYCRCRLCMRSDGKKNLKSVLISVSSADFDRENTKANKAASQACTNKQSTSLNLCISVNEKHITAVSVPEKVSLEKTTKAEAELKVSPFRKSAKRSPRPRHLLVTVVVGILVIGVLSVLYVYLGIAIQKTGNHAAPQATSATCTGNQFWMVHTNATILCEDCGSCLPGQGLSHECGKRISSNTTVTCVPCEPGITFSSKYDTSTCTPCGSPCSEDQVVLQNCTPTMNIKCSKITTPCSASQFTMVHTDGTISCKDCRSCPFGQGLSHECGSKISSNSAVTCVPCQAGISFSSEYDTSSCTLCGAPCPEDQVVLQNCTPTTNVKCDKHCYSQDRYYYDDLGSCMSCSKCCGDNKDVVENECEQKLGAASNKICSFLSSVNRCDTPTTVSSIQETTTVLNTTTSVPFTLTRAIYSAMTLTASIHQSTLTQGAQSIPHLSKTKQDLDNSANVIVPVGITMGLLLLIIAGCLTFFLYSRGRCSYLRRQHETCVVMNSEGVSCQMLTNINKVQLGGITLAESSESLLSKEAPITSRLSQENTAKVSKPLNSLLEDENALERICACLDTAVPGCGHYREVAQYYGFNHYQIVSVLEKNHGGPTRALIEKLAATHTELTVEEFATVVEDKTKRKDVSQRLRDFDLAED